MSDLTNGGFELGGSGVATGWSFLSSTTGSAATPFESFEDGWGNTSTSPALAGALFGGQLSIELFERLWGPADGSDTNLPDVVPPGTYTENASFRATLTQIAAGPALDSFETWAAGPYILDFADLSSVSTAAESFESGWDNDVFYDELVDGVTLEATTFYVVAPQTIENFDTARVVDGHEIVNILSAPLPEGDYTTFINSVPFKVAGVSGDSVNDLSLKLAAVIDTSTYPYASSQWQGASTFYIRNLGTASMLLRVEGPVNDGTDIKVETALYVPNYWLMPLE